MKLEKHPRTLLVIRSRRAPSVPFHTRGTERVACTNSAPVTCRQRLLSSIAAFVRTLKAHRKTLQRVVDGEDAQGVSETRPRHTASRTS